MKAYWLAIVVVAGCGFPRPLDVNPDATQIDSGSAGDPICFGSFVHVCFPSASVLPTTPTTFGDTDIDTDATDDTSLCDQHNDQKHRYCVVVTAGLTLLPAKTIIAHGSKPLVLLSSRTLDISVGRVDVSSQRTGPDRAGAGANPSEPGACSFVTAPIAPALGGGAYGASFGSRGGIGGSSNPPSGSHGVPGSPLVGFPASLRGGCKGGDGAVLGTVPEGRGGNGGGAVALVAAEQIRLGQINASGAGGHGGPATATSGGGGGGSGGMIIVDTPLPLGTDPATKLWANGGSGGQGGSPTTAGDDGNASNAPDLFAPGTNGSDIAGGDGGNGSIAADPGISGRDPGRSDGGGGGGGGGGAGFIHAVGITDPRKISPPSLPFPSAQ